MVNKAIPMPLILSFNYKWLGEKAPARKWGNGKKYLQSGKIYLIKCEKTSNK